MNRPTRGVRTTACNAAMGVPYWRMSEATYRVVHRADDSFAVELVRRGALPQTAAGFATEADAMKWIAQDKRLANVADPFHTPASQRRRGF